MKNDIEVLPSHPKPLRPGSREAHPHHRKNSGHVTLEGVVAAQTDKPLAYLRANAVPGGFPVTNDLRVEE